MKKIRHAWLVGMLTLALVAPLAGTGEAQAAATTKWPQTLDANFREQASKGMLRGCNNVQIGDTRAQVHEAQGKPFQYGGGDSHLDEFEKYTDCSVVYSPNQRVREILSPLRATDATGIAQELVKPFSNPTLVGIDEIFGKPYLPAGGNEKVYGTGERTPYFSLMLSGDAVKQVRVLMPSQVFDEQYAVRSPKAPSEIRVFLDDNLLPLSTPAVQRQDRVLVPLRGVLELLGAQVTWYENTQTALVRTGTQTIHVKIGSNIMQINHDGSPTTSESTLDVPAQIIKDRTMVPLRAISEAVHAFTGWVERDNAVYLYSPLYGDVPKSDAVDVYGNVRNATGSEEDQSLEQIAEKLPITREYNGVSVTVTSLEVLASETAFHVRVQNNSDQPAYLLAGMSQMSSGGKTIKHGGAFLDPALVSTIEPNRSSQGTVTIPGVPSSGTVLFATTLFGMKGMLEFPISY